MNDDDGPGLNYRSWRQVFRDQTRSKSRFVPPPGAILQTRQNLKTDLPEQVWLFPNGAVIVRPEIFHSQTKEMISSDFVTNISFAKKRRRDSGKPPRRMPKPDNR